jgi:hypothetical protein
MDWKEDALTIAMPHQKNDQAGEKPKDPKHVYANPLRPEICPILALALYFIQFPETFQHGGSVFKGQKPYERYEGAESILTDLLVLGTQKRSKTP